MATAVAVVDGDGGQDAFNYLGAENVGQGRGRRRGLTNPPRVPSLITVSAGRRRNAYKQPGYSKRVPVVRFYSIGAANFSRAPISFPSTGLAP